ncbi:cysteine dioxygenase [Geodermatophilus sabuli]|uniref:Cysteine dioxygenase type I n=1 Tax=Geodermatophilus sabuli TaxID=1564158 RepID=A0A285EJ56_9ACTN|nr:cysteine dioxygenase family protein [Geodermatophilus sabuli]MBB3083738.1 mannose-6-phosphate isomerase-like protein (cupin superfamily) [Geodermatophilus sabuli]SNX99169.1 Cysteine dioxygenase type I [Geodermatophilus sabuli]
MTRSLLSPARRATAGDPTRRRTGAAALAAALAAAEPRWSALVEYRPESRWTHLLDPALAADALDLALHPELADAQVWLLSWLPGQGTGLHDHGGSAGAFAVVRGALDEEVGALPDATRLTAGRVRPFGAHHVHRVSNTGTGAAVSVHVYTPRLTVMNTYRVDRGGLIRTGTERAGVDW